MGWETGNGQCLASGAGQGRQHILAGFHALNLGMFDLALSYKKEGMLAYSKFQQEEFAHGKEDGYMAITHQKFVGTGYFDRVMNCVTGGESSVEALEDSTEKAQF